VRGLGDVYKSQQQYPVQVFIYQADVTQVYQVRALFAAVKTHFGEVIHAVVNYALIQFEFNGDARPKVETLTWEMLQRQFSGAVPAALNTTQAALDDMKQAGFGRMVNIRYNPGAKSGWFLFLTLPPPKLHFLPLPAPRRRTWDNMASM
ncbi:SDR family oxidoreductase, partial [Lysinibacillus sp. AR18-8]|uniref:SDR family NAD(P)-dependent oxidoreductase n=1 Tax=Lysinibacillus sp. AR18-8 TaxID=1889781 RepID=UPI001C30F86A